MFLRALVLCLFPLWAVAQETVDPEALADIRTELTQLYAEIEALRGQLSVEAQSQGSASLTGPSVLRLEQIETQLQSLTGQVEQMNFRISQIVEDGTRRIGDLEFRLVELEGGDLSALGATPSLGGEVASLAPVGSQPVSEPETDSGIELAVSEESDFDNATQSLGDGDYANAILQFGQFLSNYPGGPLSARALFHMGEAQEALGQHREAARSYLDSFTVQPDGSYAPQALMRVGVSLAQLGKLDNACRTLTEVLSRYPTSGVVEETRNTQTRLGCS